MKHAKYVIVGHFGLELPIIFSPTIEHNYVIGHLKPISAGFCHKDGQGNYTVSGSSDSLKLNSRPEDANILNYLLLLDY